ncbi:MAG: Omp28-related outer membrane protein [Alistipes sp.]
MTFALVAAMFSACSSSNDEPTPTPPVDGLVLKASKATLTANGTDKVTFTVTKAQATVAAEIYLIAVDGVKQDTKLTSNEFSSSKNGVYTFEARHEGLVSNKENITAKGESVKNEKYYRNVCIMKTTDITCSFCPQATRNLNDLANRIYPDRLIQMAFHSEGHDDPMEVPEATTLNRTFGFTGNPSAVTDLREDSKVTGPEVAGLTREAVGKSLSEFPATCGIRINSSVSGGKINITAGVTSNTGGSYRVAVYVLESNIRHRQYDGGLWNETFKHDHVVRKMLSKNIYGDTLGALAADQEKTKEYSIALAEGWVLDNLNVVVYVVDEHEVINNVAECPANNGSIAYRLNVAQ